MFSSSKLLLAALAAAAASLPATASAAPLAANTTAVISGTPDLLGLLATPVADSSAGPQAVSADGNLVVFQSKSDGLVPGADPDARNVFVKNMATGDVTLVSRATGPNGEPSHSNCGQAAISADGKRVAFACEGPLTSDDTNIYTDVYLRDLGTGETMLVSRAGGLGAAGASNSGGPSIDATGTHVAFTSTASNLGDGAPANLGRQWIYVREIGNGDSLRLVSRANGAMGAAAGDGSTSPSISGDGTKVAFETGAALDPADNNGDQDVYVRDLGASTTKLVSRGDGVKGTIGDGDSFDPLISGNGQFVAFSSHATQFDHDHDPSADVDVYRRALATSATQLVSVTIGGTKGNLDSSLAGISSDGSSVAFVTGSTDLDPADGSTGKDAYVNTAHGMVLASRLDGPDGAALNDVEGAALSANGQALAMTLGGSVTPIVEPRVDTVALRRLDTSGTAAVSRPAGGGPFLNQGGSSFTSSVSADGRYVAFESANHGLGVPDGVGGAILVRDTLTGAVTVVSRQDGRDGPTIPGVAFDPQISADGRRVAFEVSDGVGDEGGQIYVRDIPAGRTYRIDRADGPNGAPANGGSFEPTISDDGRRVAFLTVATNLGDGDTDGQVDAHVRDIDTGQTLLVSRADGAAGAKANAGSSTPEISGSGLRVAFASAATNLNDGDSDPNLDVHVRDLQSGHTLLASVLPSRPKGDGNSFNPSISRDGNRVSFLSDADFGSTPPGRKLYVRDLIKRTVTLAGRADGPGGAPLADAVTNAPVLSADGNVVAFVAQPGFSIAPGAPADGSDQAYERNLTTGATRLVSRATGANGAPVPGPGAVELDGLTADGACVTFSTDGRLLPVPASTDFPQVYMRVLTADCGGRAKGPSVLSPASADTVAPTLSHVRLTRKRFRVGAKPTALRARIGRGTALSLRVSEAARLTVTVERRRVVHHRRVFRRAGTLVRSLKAGPARIAFSGRLGHRRLAAGRYRLTLVARDAAGNVSRRSTLAFTVVR